MTTTPPANQRATGAAEGEPGPRQRPGDTDRQRTAPARRTDTDERDAQRPPRSTGAPSAASAPGQGSAPTSRRILGYQRQRFEARKVRRLVRHVDPWSMLKLSLLISLCMWLIGMIASVIMWTVARNAGTIDSIEDLVNSSLSLQNWTLDGEFIFRQFGVLSLLGALGFTAAVVVASLVFNLVSDIIGGVWISVIEEETARPVAESKTAGRFG